MSEGLDAVLAAGVRYRPGWQFRIHAGATLASWSCAGNPEPVTSSTSITLRFGEPAFLIICLDAEDSGCPGRTIRLQHTFAVPPAEPAFGWDRWLLDRCLDVDRHEGCEIFEVGGFRVFYPEHGPDGRLYQIVRRGPTGLDRVAREDGS